VFYAVKTKQQTIANLIASD